MPQSKPKTTIKKKTGPCGSFLPKYSCILFYQHGIANNSITFPGEICTMKFYKLHILHEAKCCLLLVIEIALDFIHRTCYI